MVPRKIWQLHERRMISLNRHPGARSVRWVASAVRGHFAAAGFSRAPLDKCTDQRIRRSCTEVGSFKVGDTLRQPCHRDTAAPARAEELPTERDGAHHSSRYLVEQRHLRCCGGGPSRLRRQFDPHSNQLEYPLRLARTNFWSR